MWRVASPDDRDLVFQDRPTRRERASRARLLEPQLRRQIGQVFELQEAGWGPRRPTRANSLLLLCGPALLATSRVRSALQPALRRPRRFVTWLSVSREDRDLFFQDPHVFSGRGWAPARANS